jgi:hypothetical protein
MDEPLDEPLARAITAADLLETTVFLIEKTASPVAQTRDGEEYVQAVSFVAAFADHAARHLPAGALR